MDCTVQSPAMDRTFATVELFEHIFTYVFAIIHPITDHEDPRSVKTHANACTIRQLLSYQRVCRSWQRVILGSKHLQRVLFILPDVTTDRSRDQASPNHHKTAASYYRAPSMRAPILNPVIQTTFPAYNFRFCWNWSDKHCAFMIITRHNFPSSTPSECLSKMLLSQPPCMAVQAQIYEERDETKEYVGRTTTLKYPVISCEEGLTLRMVHDKVRDMFEEHKDVAAIKLITL